MAGNSEQPTITTQTNEQLSIIPDTNPLTENNPENTFKFILKAIQNHDENTKMIIIFKLIDELFEKRSKSKIIIEILKNLEEDGTKLIESLHELIVKPDKTTEEQQPENKRNKRKHNEETITDVNMDTNHTHTEPENAQKDNEFGFPKENRKRKNPVINNQNKPSPSTSTANNDNTQPQKPKQVPPITLPNHETYQAIKKAQLTEKINIISAKEVNNQIKIYPTTPDDHRKITKLLDTHNQEYYSINIDLEKTMKIVIKGLPTFLKIEDIAEELQEYGYTIAKIDRMYRKFPNDEKMYYSSILVQLPITEKNKEIYNLRILQDMQIHVETKRTNASVQQCHRCQRFGHNHFGCKMAPKCHRCAGDHHFTECTKPTSIPAKCCNCGGAHPANATVCPKYPSNNQRNTSTHQPNNNNQTTTPRPQSKPVSKNISYAQITNTTNNPTNHLLSIIKQMNDATNALTAYLTHSNINIQQ